MDCRVTHLCTSGTYLYEGRINFFIHTSKDIVTSFMGRGAEKRIVTYKNNVCVCFAKEKNNNLFSTLAVSVPPAENAIRVTYLCTYVKVELISFFQILKTL